MATTPAIESTPERARRERGRGRGADAPRDVPKPGWKDVAARVRAEVKADNISLLSGGVAFYALLALVPGLVATVSVYGLVADPSSISRRVNDLLGAAPVEVRNLVETQLRTISESSHAKLGLGAVAGFVVAVWSAAKGMRHLVTALNVAYDEDETRGFVRLRAISLMLTVGAIVFVMLAVFAVAVLPSALGNSALGAAGRWSIDVLRWPALGLGLIVGLALLYRYGPDRHEPKWRWVSPGAVFATAGWLIVSLLFSLYAANFGRYNQTYGSLSAVIVVMLWLFLTVAVVILGAELNAELERQTLRDSTRGPDRPLGNRGAAAADTVGATAGEIRERVRDRRGPR